MTLLKNDRILIAARLNIALMFASLVMMAVPALATAGNEAEPAKTRQDLRLYRINKDGISDRFWFTRKKARQPGCHNIAKRSRLHRAVQFGYAYCRIYAAKNCAADTVLSFTRDDEPMPTINLSQGYSWFTVSENKRGELIKSWFCSHDPVPPTPSTPDEAN